MTMTSNSKLHFPTEETTTPITQQDQHRPLLSHMSLDPNNGTNNNAKETSSQMYYGAITENNISMHGGDGETNADQKHPSSPQHTSSYNVVNHGHAYSDAVLGGVVDANIIEGHGADADEHKQNAKRNPKEKVSYWSIVKSNGNFRWYMMSYLVTIAGEWFTYVASIAAIEEIHSSQSTISRTSISILVAVRLLPNAIFSNIGGVLADSYDRRTILMALDVLGSLIAWFFLLAYYFKSISALYMATALQMTVAAIYEPSHSAIAPMIVFDEESLKKALTLSGLAWSVMTGVGSSIGGFAVGWVGISMCFVIDSVSYFTSAVFLWKLQGSYRATESTETIDTTSVPLSSSGTQCSLTSPPANAMDETGETNNEQSSFLSWKQLNNMTAEGLSYLRSKPWGPFVFLKFFAAIIYGAADVLNVSFSERGLDGNEMDGSSQRLGILFAFVGIGCFLGPILADPLTNMDQPKSLERICLISYLSMAVGCWGLSKIQSFTWVCVFTAVRSAGSSVIWIDSSLLLQKFATNNMLGRVMAVDYALATLSEAVSAMCGGILQDDFGLSAEQVSYVMALVAVITLGIWGVYFYAVRI